MPPRKRLRAVGEAERAAQPVRPMTVLEAAQSGSRRNVLVATRDRIAIAVQDAGTPARDLAALTKRLTDVVHEIELIDAREAHDGEAGPEVEDGKFDKSAI